MRFSASSTSNVSFLILMPLLLGACAPAAPEADGTLAFINGKITKVNPAEEAKICQDQFCEPNLIYQASFGRSRPAPAPQPAPPSLPVTPDPYTAPVPVIGVPSFSGLPTESLDYSKRILNIESAWEITEGSRDVIVAVIDSGVDYNHPDLRGNMWINEREQSGSAGIDDDGNGYIDDVYGWDWDHGRANAFDDNRHGTHCAGIIGAEANGIGTVGINKKVRIMPLKFLAANGRGDTYGAIQAIYYAVQQGAKVISNSWAGSHSVLLNQAVQYAQSRGVVIVAAAGNETSNNDYLPTYPAGYPGVISVGSTDEGERISSFSNFGQGSVTIAAPGSDIYSTVPGARFAQLSGTSMAAPQVAGAIALALSVKPNASGTELSEALCETSRKIHLGYFQCGRMDVGAFIQRLAL